ncbi:hypothetical protein FRC07_001031 [Ceratobasidium sp. 392]|nr:hypothetical protein FRC07_001031 [Ceratobasidium sp. 392]
MSYVEAHQYFRQTLWEYHDSEALIGELQAFAKLLGPLMQNPSAEKFTGLVEFISDLADACDDYVARKLTELELTNKFKALRMASRKTRSIPVVKSPANAKQEIPTSKKKNKSRKPEDTSYANKPQTIASIETRDKDSGAARQEEMEIAAHFLAPLENEAPVKSETDTLPFPQLKHEETELGNEGLLTSHVVHSRESHSVALAEASDRAKIKAKPADQVAGFKRRAKAKMERETAVKRTRLEN